MSGRIRIALAAVVAAFSLAVVAAPAMAGTLDQQQTQQNAFFTIAGPQTFLGTLRWAQTFTAQRSGLLDQVDVYLHTFASTTGPLTVEIRDVSNDGTNDVPGSTVLASASVPASLVPIGLANPTFVSVPFADPAASVAGTRYAIVLSTGGSDAYNAFGQAGDVYAGGAGFESSGSASPPVWNGDPEFCPGGCSSPIDLAFKTYVAPWDFTGFSAPVNNPTDPENVNSVKAGQSVPVKFSLGGNQGLDVVADGYPKLVFTSCDSGAVDPVEETSTANSGLSYDALTGTYTYVWKTVKSWKGKCGTFTLKLDDGSEHTADFVFK